MHVQILVKRRLPIATALIIPIMMGILGCAGGASGLPRDNASAGKASAGAESTGTIVQLQRAPTISATIDDDNREAEDLDEAFVQQQLDHARARMTDEERDLLADR